MTFDLKTLENQTFSQRIQSQTICCSKYLMVEWIYGYCHVIFCDNSCRALFCLLFTCALCIVVLLVTKRSAPLAFYRIGCYHCPLQANSHGTRPCGWHLPQLVHLAICIVCHAWTDDVGTLSLRWYIRRWGMACRRWDDVIRTGNCAAVSLANTAFGTVCVWIENAYFDLN